MQIIGNHQQQPILPFFQMIQESEVITHKLSCDTND